MHMCVRICPACGWRWKVGVSSFVGPVAVVDDHAADPAARVASHIGEPDAVALAKTLEPAHKQLNALRRAPDPVALEEAISELDGALEDVRDSAYASHEGVVTALERYDALNGKRSLPSPKF